MHLCGTFTGSLGQTLLVVRSSNITIYLAGAKLTSPAWSGAGAIDMSKVSNVVVDGGGTGVIQNTANGTTLGHKNNSAGIYAWNCNGCQVKNLTIANMYVHTSVYDSGVSQSQVNCVSFLGSSNFTINNVTCHDAGWAFAGYGNNFTLEYSRAYNIDHGLAFGAAGSIYGVTVHDNHIYNFANWDTTTNRYHHDGLHLWGQNGGRISGGAIYNNRFDGDSGVNITGDIFIQDSVSHIAVYNNVFVVLSTRYNHALWFCASSTSLPGGAATGNSAHNNTISAGGHSQGGAMLVQSQVGFSSYNNVLMGGQSDITIYGGGSISGINNNVYVDLISFNDRNTFGYQGKVYQTLAQWKAACRCDGSSLFVSPSQVGLSSTGQITVGSAAVGAGANLTSLASGSLSALASDILGALRPGSGSWDAGAFQTGSAPAKPGPVGGVTATVQ